MTDRLHDIEQQARDESAAAAFLLKEYVEPFGERGIHMADARQVVACLHGVVALAAELRAAADREQQLREAVENLLEDVDDAMRDDPLLHDLEIRIGARFLGFGGGFNHEDDLRTALAAVSAPPAKKDA